MRLARWQAFPWKTSAEAQDGSRTADGCSWRTTSDPERGGLPGPLDNGAWHPAGGRHRGSACTHRSLLVRARAGLPRGRAPDPGSWLRPPLPPKTRGLVVGGLHVQRSSEQLACLLTLPGTGCAGSACQSAAGNGRWREAELDRLATRYYETLVKHETPVVFTSRVIERPAAMSELEVARRVSSAPRSPAGFRCDLVLSLVRAVSP